ncbi:MAG: hypothetical protein LBQ12_10185 [Deltaproteobacteria bacterium]|nr:hypothetical protein [Deltaproteobacteria bacterium]
MARRRGNGNPRARVCGSRNSPAVTHPSRTFAAGRRDSKALLSKTFDAGRRDGKALLSKPGAFGFG